MPPTPLSGRATTRRTFLRLPLFYRFESLAFSSKSLLVRNRLINICSQISWTEIVKKSLKILLFDFHNFFYARYKFIYSIWYFVLQYVGTMRRLVISWPTMILALGRHQWLSIHRYSPWVSAYHMYVHYFVRLTQGEYLCIDNRW